MVTLPTVDLAELVDGTGDAAFAVNAAHTIVAWNRAAEELLPHVALLRRRDDVALREHLQVEALAARRDARFIWK